MAQYILTAFCKDRPGVVADISEVIYENGCNLESSAMTNLADEFAIMLVFSALDNGAAGADLDAKLERECRRLEREKGITAFIRRLTDPMKSPHIADVALKTIQVEGLDQAGIVYKVSRFLADNRINIRTLNSAIKSSPESGAPIYHMQIVVEIPDAAVLSEVQDGLNEIEDQLNVDISIE